MKIEEAIADLMLAQADVFYRPKDDSIDMAIKALENQKTGHWIDCGDRDLWYRCSECRKRMWSGNCYNYCPNCGAKMEGENK